MQEEGVQYVVEALTSQAVNNFEILDNIINQLNTTSSHINNNLGTLSNTIDDIGIDSVNTATNNFEELDSTIEDLTTTSNRSNNNLSRLGRGIREVGTTSLETRDSVDGLTKKIKDVLTITAIIGTTKKVIDIFGSFENQMNAVEAVSGETGKEMEALSAQASKLGADTNYSATEAGAAQEALLRLGNTTKETMTMVGDVLNFDRANKVGDLAKSSEILSSSLKMFGMSSKEAGRAADAMAMTTKNSKTTVEYLSSAFNNAGADAKNLGYDIEDTLTLIGGMSNNFAEGSSAGTALKGIFSDLSNNAKLFAKEGVKVTDNNGKFRQVEDIVKDLNKVLSDKTPIEKQEILNSLFSETGKAAYNALGVSANSIENLEYKIRNASGTTNKMAEIMDSGLKPKIDGMMGSAETLAIEIGTKLNPVFLGGVSAMTNLINTASNAVSHWEEFYQKNQTIIDTIAILSIGIGVYISITKAMIAWDTLVVAIKTSGTVANVAYTLAIGASTAFTEASTIATGALAAAQWLLNEAWICNPIGLVIIGVSGLILGIRYAISHFQWFRDIISYVWNLFTDNPISRWISDTIDKFTALRKAVDGFKDGVSKLFGWKGNKQEGVNKIVDQTPNEVIKKSKLYIGVDENSLSNALSKISNTKINDNIKLNLLKNIAIDKVKSNPQKNSSITNTNNKTEKKLEIKQSVTNHITITEASKIDANELANKVSATTKKDILNSILNGAKLAGI